MSRRFTSQLHNFRKFILQERQGKRISCLLLINIFALFIMWFYCVYTDSMALTAFCYLSIFNILRLCCCFVSIWVQKQHSNFSYSFGYERFEVLSVFVCTMLMQLGGFFIFKESFERLIHSHSTIKSESQFMVVILGSVLNFLVTYGIDNKSFALVAREAPPSCLQDTLFDFGKSICGVLPVLSRIFLFRLNPFMILSYISALIVIIESILIEYRDANDADTISAMLITFMTIVTMYPLSLYSGLILVQANPKEIRSSVEKCLKEANTLDGLLEFRQEHVWSISFGKYAGSFHVRIRRDANEQLILAQLTNTLSPYLHYITIQIFKDDWKSPVASSVQSQAYEIHHKDSYNSIGNKFVTDFSQKRTTLYQSAPNYVNQYKAKYKASSTTVTPQTKDPTKVQSKYNGPKITINFD